MDELKMDLENLNRAIQIYENIRQEGKMLDEDVLALAYIQRGTFYFQINRFDESIVDYTKCIEIMERLLTEKKSPNVNELAKAYSCMQGDDILRYRKI